jgi:AbrB family looped-hinge helix DNA binding protein
VRRFTLYPMKSKVASKGQITLPAEIRARLGLAAGTPVLFELTEDAVVLRKGAIGPHPVDRLYGHLDLPKPVDALLDEMRGPRPAKRSAGRRGTRHARK